MAETDENTTNPQQVPPTPQASHILSTIKLHILKKGEYDIWAMKMEHFLEHTDYPIWEVIQKGNERLHKGYDRFQSLLSQLETHGAGVSTEDANQKFLRSLPSSWSQISLIMRTKPSVNTLNFDDLYNNLRVFEYDVKGVDWTGHAEDDTKDYALMAFNSSNSGSDTEMSAKDKSGLGSGDVEDSAVNDRFAKVEGMHAVPPPMTGNYMPPQFDFGIDESKFIYGPKQSTTSESDAKTSDLDSYESSSSEETLETVHKPVKSKPKVVNEPKVWTNAPIIEEYESDSDDEHVTIPSKEQEKPSFAFC
nr:ribonuclease H-like domain-containing protein [Tanacetum cinerariifolium]